MSETAAVPPTASERRRYRLGMADGVYGPGDVEALVVADGGPIGGPKSSNWQPDSMLAICEEPIIWQGESVSFLVINPSFVGVTLSSIREKGGVVAVGRILPGHDPREWRVLKPDAIAYWGAGVLSAAET
jgi:hypothetical protein